MRNCGRLRLGYYPLAEVEARRIQQFFQFPPSEVLSALDPCSGTGAALRSITAGATTRLYGIELDAYRAEEAPRNLDEVIQGSAFDTHAPVESFSLVYLNPPYDFEVGEGRNERIEKLFLEQVGRWVRPGGVLVMVVPGDRVFDCRNVLTIQFRDKAIYRLTAPEAAAYKQVVVFGIRRTRAERERMTDLAVQQGNAKLYELTRRYDEIPALPDTPDRTYPVPASGPVRLEYRSLPLDQIEDLLDSSPAWRQAQRITHAPKAEFHGRPLTPLHKGHVGLLCTSSLLNGCFGAGADLHAAYWESAKVVDRSKEEGDGGSMVIREKERFSQRLTLLFADGRIALLSEKPREHRSTKEDSNEERASAHGEADLRSAVS